MPISWGSSQDVAGGGLGAMLPGGPLRPVDPRNERGHAPASAHALDDGWKRFGVPAAIRHRPEPRICCLHDERRAEARPTSSV